MENSTDVQLLALQLATPSWNGITSQIEKTELLNADQKIKGLHAVTVFRQVLGKGFFMDNGQEHPLQRYWGNIVPWQIEQLSGWAIALEQLKDTSTPEGYRYMCDLLRNKVKCQQEGIHFLRLAMRLSKAGFTIAFIEGKHTGKSPDIAVTDPVTGAVFYIEVTHLEKNADYKQDEINFRYISSACMHYATFLLTYVKLLRRPSDEELDEAIAMIAATAKAVWDSGTLQHRSTDLIEITFAPESHVTSFNEWLATNGKQKGVWGLEINPDETERLTGKGRIEKKVKQIPSGATGILYFGVEFLFFLKMDGNKVMAALKRAMAPHPQLKGIVLCCHAIDPMESFHQEFEDTEDLYSAHSVEGHTTYYLYSVNDHYAGDVPATVLSQFRSTLIPSAKDALT